MIRLIRSIAVISIGLGLYLSTTLPLKEVPAREIREIGELAKELRTNKETVLLSKRLEGIEGDVIRASTEKGRKTTRIHFLCMCAFLLNGVLLGFASIIKTERA